MNFGIVTGDPAEAMFTPANFPGSSTTQIYPRAEPVRRADRPRRAIAGNARLNEDTNEYEYRVSARSAAGCASSGFSAQDSWRVRKNLTVNVGLRYEVQRPFYALNNSYSTRHARRRLGRHRGVVQPVHARGDDRPDADLRRLRQGEPAYNTDGTTSRRARPGVAAGVKGGLIGRLLGSRTATRCSAPATRSPITVPACRTSPTCSASTRASRSTRPATSRSAT